jgi:hypothetical protein
MNEETIKIIDQIGDRIASALNAMVKSDDKLVSKDWIASYFSVGRSTAERIISTPGFPEVRTPWDTTRVNYGTVAWIKIGNIW